MAIINSFTPGSIRKISLSSERLIYRWHDASANALKFGRYFSESAIMDREVARRLYAIPASNSMKYLEAYRPMHEIEAWTGKVAGMNGLPGGGDQIFLTGFVENQLVTVERIVPK